MKYIYSLLGICLLFGSLTVVAQSDSISMREWMNKLENKTQLKLAYDVNLMEQKQVVRELNPTKSSLLLLLQKHSFCYETKDSIHLIIYPCKTEDWTLATELVDPSNGERLPFASIRLLGTNRFTTSNQEGWFQFEKITSKEAMIELSYIGYFTDTVTISNSENVTRLELLPRSFLLSIVEIEELLEFIKNKQEFGEIALETDHLKSMPSIGDPDPISSLRLLPGVGGNPESSSGLSLRGGRFDQSLILYDDFQLLHMDHFFGLFSSVNHQNVKDIRVFRSGYSAKHSGFVNGMVQLTGKEGNINEPSVGISSNKLSSGFYAQVPLINKKWSTNITFRKDNSWMSIDNWNKGLAFRVIEQELTENAPNISDLSNSNSYYFFNDISLKTVFRPNERHKLTVSYLRSQDALQNDINFTNPSRDYQLRMDLFSIWINSGFSLAWNHSYGKRFKGKLSLATTNFFSETEFPIVQEILGTDTLQNQQNFIRQNQLNQARLRYDAEVYLQKDFKLNTGIELPYFQSSLEAQDDGAKIELRDSLLVSAVYFELERQYKKWDWKGGVRISYDDRAKKGLIEPRLSVAHQFNQRWAARFNYGRYYQFIRQVTPSSREGLVPDYWLLPNYQNSQPMTSNQFSLGTSYKKKNLLIDTELYLKEYDNLSEQFPDISRLYNQENNPLALSSNAKGEVAGIDLFVSNRFKNLTAWVGADLAIVENNADSLTALYQPYYANQGSIKFGGIYKWRNWELSSSFILMGGRKFTTLVENTELSTLELGKGRLDSYHRLDMAVNYSFKWKKISGLVRNSFFNLYDRTNIRGINYVPSANSSASLRGVQSNNLGFFYNLGFELHF